MKIMKCPRCGREALSIVECVNCGYQIGSETEKIIIDEETEYKFEDDPRARKFSTWVIFKAGNKTVKIPIEILENVLKESP